MHISSEAKEYIKRKGGSIYLKYPNIKGCCIEANYEPIIYMGIPADKNNYRALEFDDVVIYLDKNIRSTENLFLELKGFLGYKYLILKGWKIF